MNKVVVSMDGSEASEAGVQWCVEHLEPGTRVIAVCGIGEFGEFVISLPAADGLGLAWIEEALNNGWCDPLRQAGLRCEPRLVHRRQVPALLEVVALQQPDALIVGKPVRHAVGHHIGWGALNKVVHRMPCPVVLVPTKTDHIKTGRSRRAPLVRAHGHDTSA